MKAQSVTTDFKFMRWAKLMGALSLAAVIFSFVLLGTKGLNLGLDFTGGTVLEVKATQDIELDEVREALEAGGHGDAVAQHFGGAKEVMVRIPPRKAAAKDESVEEAAASAAADNEGDRVGQEVFELLAKDIEGLELIRKEFIGPQVGDELRDQSGLAILIAIGMMMLYLWFRFTNKLGVAAVSALAHDVIIVLGVFAFFQIPFDLTVLAAVLAVVGYSINDTIVIADHIREDFRNSRLSEPVDLIDLAVNRTLSRTMITGLTTLFVLLALYLFGGEMIRGFSLALIIGVIVGTYSSIYVVNGLLLLMKVTKEDFIPPEINDEVDDMP